MAFTKDMTIADAVSAHPDARMVFMRAGMGCCGCAIANDETIEQGAQAHGTDPDKLVEQLNKLCGDETENACGGSCCGS